MRGVCLCARRLQCDPLLHLTHLGEPLQLWQRIVMISRAQAMASAAVMIKDGLEFLCFATIGSAAKWRSLNGVLEKEINSGLAFICFSYYLCKFLTEQQSRRGLPVPCR
jgi:hypothetical protein